MYPAVVLIITAFILALVLVVITIPPIIRVSKAKKLFDHTNDRKLHTSDIPVIGGVAIFIGFILSAIISTNGYNIDSLKYIIAAIIILFFTGMKDDLLIISANKKFIIQLLAALMLVTLGDIHISNLQWVFWVREISYPVSVFITLLLIMGTVNAYNMIDGIDGLASGLGILSSVVFGVWFYLAGDIPCAVMAFALSGSLTGFFIFNVFGKENKLFMGDTGSLIIGLISGVLVVRFVELNLDPATPYALHASPAVAFAILLVPLFDLARVFIVRLSEGKSPFFADTNHIHHRLLKLLPNHLSVTLTIIAVNALIIAVSFYLSRIGMAINLHLLILVLLGIFFSMIPVFIYSLRQQQSSETKKKRISTAFRSTLLNF